MNDIVDLVAEQQLWAATIIIGCCVVDRIMATRPRIPMPRQTDGGPGWRQSRTGVGGSTFPICSPRGGTLERSVSLFTDGIVKCAIAVRTLIAKVDVLEH